LLALDWSATDVTVWEFARENGLAIVTKDSDLSELSILRGFPPSVVWIRRGNCSTREIETILRNHVLDLQQLAKIDPGGILLLY
jgi:predicted nuclease of predicted toxin-antitoxin system